MQFRTKARAVDLLGKGQIADLPTAITELWKNGYDAYADNVSAELYLEGYKDLNYTFFVMADDGKGMSRNDILEKWLVLGTDSKSRINNQDIEGIETLWKKPRIKAGEKGIGRLSVAYLGSPMLMLTKKQGYPLQALYFDWRLLENFNLFLDDINIPIAEITNETTFNEVFSHLKDDFLSNFNQKLDKDGTIIWSNLSNSGELIWEEEQQNLKNRIIESTKKLVLPSFFEEEFITPLIDLNNSHGTKFIIFEPEEQIEKLPNIDSQSEEDNENDLDYVLKSISGFLNEFTENKLPLNVTFPIHKTIGHDYDFLQSKWKFFSPQDFNLGDILIDGEFNGVGQFKGSIKLYDDEPFEYIFSSSRKKDSRSDYGSFNLKLGYNMGRESESKLEGDIYTRFYEKLKEIGGLYIYRDGFRVLPYGRQEVDFLEFEKRRTIRAGDSFFSYRRMFGYIQLSRFINDNLKDKASREGIINNGTYRAFLSDLQEFFISLAKEFFATNPNNPIFINKTEQLKSKSEALKKDREREKAEKTNFTKSLKEYPEKFALYQQNYDSILAQLEEKLNQTNVLYSDIEYLLEELKRLEISYKDLIPKIPKRYEPTDTQLERLAKYESQIIRFNESTKANSAILLDKVQEKLAIRDLIREFEKNTNRYKGSLQTITNNAKDSLEKKFRLISQEFNERVNRAIEELEKYKNFILPSLNSKEGAISASQRIRELYEFQKEQIDNTIIPLVDYIGKLSFDIDEEAVQGAYRSQYEQIKYQWEQTRETAQLGIAVEIIDHEFNILYATINQLVKRIDNNFDISLFNHLKSLFSQLEDKYALLSPLYRISGVVPKDIDCGEIYKYIGKFFSSKLKEESIIFKATKAFENHKIFIKEPVIHTVFINIINNAIYWLRNSVRKEILLDYFPDTNEILIANSGEKIQDYRLDKIFELFYSTRPNGRGIGLYLAKQSLNESYFEINATNDPHYNTLNGACFVIKPLN